MIRNQHSARLIHTIQSEYVSSTEQAGLAFSADSFSWRNNAGSVLHIFMYGSYSPLTLISDYFNSAKQAVIRPCQRPDGNLSIRQLSEIEAVEPTTIHRSREGRQLAMFSF